MRRTTVLLIWTLLVLLPTLPAPAAACPPVHRSAAVRRAFQRAHPCPATGRTTGACPGYVVDHIVPLCHTGQAGDRTDNMQWQEAHEAQRKDRWERALCRQQPRPCPPVGD